MPRKTLEALAGQPLEGLRSLVRVDFNVPVQDGVVTDRTRIDAALPTIRWLRDRGCRVVLLSHFGRPRGGPDPRFSLRVVLPALEAALGLPVLFLDDPTSEATVKATRRMKRGDVALGENTRFFPGEETNDPGLARQFAALGDFYVNDAFGSAHRAHASTEGVAHLLKPAVAGFLMARELQYLGDALARPARPFVAVLGGAKISGKIDVIENLLPRVDAILVGGAMACTFFAAMGLEVGGSLVEPDRLDLAGALLKRAGEKLVLPPGAVVARTLAPDADVKEVSRDRIEPGWAMYDIDQRSIQEFGARIVGARTVVWNGPMGVFETPPFDRGTLAVARALADATRQGAVTVVGGGDSAAALAQAGLTEAVTHVSTGGGAALEFLEGKTLPGVAALDEDADGR
jgi:phosphoglycerate kinase